jgi:hypothetical protein
MHGSPPRQLVVLEHLEESLVLLLSRAATYVGLGDSLATLQMSFIVLW